MGMAGVNVSDRLSLKDQRRNKSIKVSEFPRFQTYPLAGFLKRSEIGLMSGRGSVVKLLKRTASLTVTGVADIRRLRDNQADHFLVFFANRSTVSLNAVLAEFCTFTGRAKTLNGAVLHEDAGMI